MKLPLWLLISVALHLLAVIALNFRSEPAPMDIGDVVDLTVMNPTVAQSPKAASLPPAPRVVQKSAAIESSAEGKSENSSPSVENSESLGGASSDSPTTVGWSEVTRLPKVKREVKAQYPEEAKKAGIDGPVILEILIDKTGRVHHAQLISGPGFGLNESALEAIKKFEFQPAFKGEESVAVKIRYTYRFKLEIN